ncbi:unnamed protein product [Orchesella dallaii]|uniref:Uncharacterized protein n=1 Tax=Orchesella dallaii TaxID=48710 RepID=A0ABP1QJP4_9HEXA
MVITVGTIVKVGQVTRKNCRILPKCFVLKKSECCDKKSCCGECPNRKFFSTLTKDESDSMFKGTDFIERSRQVLRMNNNFDMSQSFQGSPEWMNKLLESMLVYTNFVSTAEETTILKKMEPCISRLYYETSPLDDTIHDYRETERAKRNQSNTQIINRIRSLCFPPAVPQLRFVHILDLAMTEVIKPHIDSVRFSGNTIAGLSLLSNSIMRLRHDVQKDFSCDVFLSRLSPYVMREFVHYEFTHGILGEKASTFMDKVICRDRRISVIRRNEPENFSTEPEFKPLSSPEH